MTWVATSEVSKTDKRCCQTFQSAVSSSTRPNERTTTNIRDLGVWDAAVRKGWKHFFVDIDGVIFLVDANDRDRFPEARAELEVSELAMVSSTRRGWSEKEGRPAAAQNGLLGIEVLLIVAARRCAAEAYGPREAG